MTCLLAASLLAIAAGVLDARSGRIPNILTVPSLLGAVAARALLEGTTGLLGSVAGAVVVGLVPYLLFTFSRGRGIGGGDVKLFAALGAWLGPSLGVEAQFLSFGCLLMWALGLLAWRGRLLAVLVSTLQLAFGWALPKRWRRVPAAETLTSLRMGPAIAAGTLGVSLLEVLETFSWAS